MGVAEHLRAVDSAGGGRALLVISPRGPAVDRLLAALDGLGYRSRQLDAGLEALDLLRRFGATIALVRTGTDDGVGNPLEVSLAELYPSSPVVLLIPPGKSIETSERAVRGEIFDYFELREPLDLPRLNLILARASELLSAWPAGEATPAAGWAAHRGEVAPPAAAGLAPGLPDAVSISSPRAAAPRTVVALVEDSTEIRLALGAVLEEQGYRVVTFEAAEPALAALAQQPPAALLLDIHLPGMDGLAALRTIRASPAIAQLPVLVITADATDDRVRQALGSGADDFLVKPIHPELLLRRLERVLGEPG